MFFFFFLLWIEAMIGYMNTDTHFFFFLFLFIFDYLLYCDHHIHSFVVILNIYFLVLFFS